VNNLTIYSRKFRRFLHSRPDLSNITLTKTDFGIVNIVIRSVLVVFLFSFSPIFDIHIKPEYNRYNTNDAI